MLGQCLAPGMEHGGDAQLGSQVFVAFRLESEHEDGVVRWRLLGDILPLAREVLARYPLLPFSSFSFPDPLAASLSPR